MQVRFYEADLNRIVDRVNSVRFLSIMYLVKVADRSLRL